VAAAKRVPRKALGARKPKAATAALLSPEQAALAFRRAGMISLWVGRFDSESDLEMYIDGGDFERDAGYTITRGLEPFPAFADGPGDPFTGYGFATALLRRVSTALEDSGLRANSAVLQMHFRYEPARVRTRSKAKLSFLGSYRS